jgi:CRP-like cAMP-binding protein
MNLLHKSNCSIKELTYTISSFIKYEFLPKDHLLFRLGDKGEKYYIILKGSVSILIAKDIKMDLTEEEFFKFVKKLISNNEAEILYKTIIHNVNVFPNVCEMAYQKSTDGLKTIRQMSTKNSFINKIITVTDLVENPHLSLEDYINLNLPNINEKDKKERKQTTVFKYFNVVTLKAGDTFGEVALTSTSQKR